MNSPHLTTRLLLRRSYAAAGALVIAMGAAQAQSTNYPTTVLSDNPVCYYRFEELPGAGTAVDSTTNGIDATYNFSSDGYPVLGLAGLDTNSIGFNGDSANYGNVDIPFSPLLAPLAADGIHGAAFSFEAWVQTYTANSGASAPYISILGMFGGFTGSAPNASGWLLGQTPGPGSQWLFNLRNGGFLQAVTVTPLQWTYIVGTFDGANEDFYVDGALVASQGGITGYVPDPGLDGSIGIVPNAGVVPSGPYAAFDGQIDEVAFYTNVLTLAQIQRHYQIGTNAIVTPVVAPGVLSQPNNATNYSETSVSFSVIASGTPPLYYQWVRQGVGPIASATNSLYTFVSQYPADDNASFYVTITNAVGSTNSQTVTLTVLTNINIIGPPFTITRTAGSHAAFRVAANGALPLGYQWSVSANGINFTNLPGQTQDTLWLTNVQLSMDSLQYQVVVTNPFSSMTESASLYVQPRTETVPLTGYGAVVAADQPVAYWRLDEASNATTAVDAVGSFDGSYDTLFGNIVWGIPPGIPNDSDPAVDLQDPQTTVPGQGGTVDVPYALELNPFGPWSVEMWVRPDSVDGSFRVPMSSMANPSSGNFVSGWNIYEYGSIPTYWTMVLYTGGASGFFGTDFGDPFTVTNQWNYLVIADDGTNIVFYVNGAVGSVTTVAGSGYTPQGLNGDSSLAGYDEYIGQRSDHAFFGANAGMDDVAIYNYALTPSQIQLHYLNKANLTYAKSGKNIILSWPAGSLYTSTNVAGPYTAVVGATSPYTVSTTNSQAFYELIVH